jgi:hypothetical protein
MLIGVNKYAKLKNYHKKGEHRPLKCSTYIDLCNNRLLCHLLLYNFNLGPNMAGDKTTGHPYHQPRDGGVKHVKFSSISV